MGKRGPRLQFTDVACPNKTASSTVLLVKVMLLEMVLTLAVEKKQEISLP
jgi:hypothetical protein